jgi:hypothetical protein
MRKTFGGVLPKPLCLKVGAWPPVLYAAVANPPTGFGSCLLRGSFNVRRRGEFSVGDNRNRGSAILGDRAKTPTMKSSTTKGPIGATERACR